MKKTHLSHRVTNLVTSKLGHVIRGAKGCAQILLISSYCDGLKIFRLSLKSLHLTESDKIQ